MRQLRTIIREAKQRLEYVGEVEPEDALEQAKFGLEKIREAFDLLEYCPASVPPSPPSTPTVPIDWEKLKCYGCGAKATRVHKSMVVPVCDRYPQCESEASPPSMEPTGFVSHQNYDGPSCTVCGAIMQPTGFKCFSCGSTPEPSTETEESIRAKVVAWRKENGAYLPALLADEDYEEIAVQFYLWMTSG